MKAELLFFYLFIFFHEKQKRRTQYVFCIKWKLGKNPGLISVAHNDSVVLMYWKQFLGNIQIGWRKNISDMWRSKLKVDFHCSVILTSVNRIETMYGRPRVNVKERTSLNLYVNAWPFIHWLSFIYARKFYVRTHVKKSDSGNQPLKSVSRCPRCTCTEVLSDTTFRPVQCNIQHFQNDKDCSFLLLLRSPSIISR